MVIVLVPAVFSIILLLPWLHHLAVNAVCIAVSILGAFETARFFSARGFGANGGWFPLAGGLLPLATYFEVSGLLPAGIVMPTLLVVVAAILAREAFLTSTDEFPRVLPRVAASIAVVIYPGLFLSYVIRFSSLKEAGLSLVVFLLIVFANDILAYLVGSTWGKGSRGFLAVSPNKSVAGFLGGMTGSILFAFLSWLLFPGVFSGNILIALGIGVGVGILTIVGDLIESAMKRSSNLKDSGTVIPGRGGLLDSVDSILFASPLCYYLLLLAGGGR